MVAHHRVVLGADYAASKGWYDGIVYFEDLRRSLIRELELSVAHWTPRPLEGRRAISLT